MKTKSASKLNVPPLEYLRECFDYNPETGKVFWRDRPLYHFGRPAGKKRADHNIGKEVGTVFYHTKHPSPCGLKTCILYQGKPINVLVHHIAWRLTNGDIPEGHEIDHRDNDSTNNVLTNLRVATHAQNLANMKNREGRELPRGVSKMGNRYQARIRIGGERCSLGCFDTPEEAHQAFLAKSEELYGTFCKHLTEREAGISPASP